MIQVQKMSKFTACLPAIQQKSLSPHETSLFCLQIQQKLSLKKTKSTTPFACNQAKNLSPHETSLRDRFTVKKTKSTDWTISLHTTLPNSHIALLEHSEHLPPFFTPCGRASQIALLEGKKASPPPSFLVREAVPDCPPQRAIWDGRPSLPSPEGQSGTILARGGHSGTLLASVPGCPPLLLMYLRFFLPHGYNFVLQYNELTLNSFSNNKF